MQRAVAECLVSQVTVLPPAYREVLRLTELAEVKQADAAERLGLSLPALKARVLRGRALLRERLEECCRIEVSAQGGLTDCIPRQSTADRRCCRSRT